MLIHQRERERKLMTYAISLSVLLHIVFFAVFIILPEFRSDRTLDIQPIYVELVGGGGGTPGPLPAVTKPQPAVNDAGAKQPSTTKPETTPEPVYIPPPVEVAPTPSNYSTAAVENPPPAEDDNVKTFAPQTVKNKDATKKVEEIQRALQQNQQQAQQQQQQTQEAVTQSQTGRESVNSAIEQLRNRQAAENTGGGGTGASTGAGTGQGTGGSIGGPLNIYLGIIIPIIEKNWSFSPSLFNGTPRMEVILSCKIMANGEITDIGFAKRSGNAYLDESAFKALAKSNPLPAFGNSGIKKPFIELQFRFTPQGLQR